MAKAFTMTAPHAADGGQFVANGNDLLIIQNTDSSSHTYTITSTADPFGRTKDITTQAIAAGAIHTFGPMQLTGWVQSDGKVYVAANSTLVKFGVIQLPG
jgi:hypothetical protein